MKNLAIILAVIALGGGVLLLFMRSVDAPRTAPETTGGSDLARLTSLPLTTYEGEEVTLEHLSGTPLVINSWAVWCPFCREELPDFAHLQEEYGERIAVIAINRAESVEKARTFTDSLALPASITFLMDRNDAFYRTIGGFTMPETLFVNAAGDIVVHKRGFMDLDEMRAHTDTIVN